MLIAYGSLYTRSLGKIALSQRAGWLPKHWKESSSRRFNGNERKDKHDIVYTLLVHKIEQRSDWSLFSVQLPCLPDCNYLLRYVKAWVRRGQSVITCAPYIPTRLVT